MSSLNKDNLGIGELFSTFPKLSSSNCVFREVTTNDIDDFLEIYGDEENSKFISHYVMKTKEEAKDYILKLSNNFVAKEHIRWGIVLKSSNKLVGLISVHSIDLWDKTAQVGYVINKKYQGQGICTECMKELINYIFSKTCIQSLEASISPENKTSISFIKKIGFKKYKIRLGYSLNRKTGEYENRFFYKLNKTDW